MFAVKKLDSHAYTRHPARHVAGPAKDSTVQHSPRWKMHQCTNILDVLKRESLANPGQKDGLDAVVTSEFLSTSRRQLFGIKHLLLVRNKRYKSIGYGKQKQHSTGGVLLLDHVTSKQTTQRGNFSNACPKEISGYTIVTAVAPDQGHTDLDVGRMAVLDEKAWSTSRQQMIHL
ncbi:hypothetical protein PV04_00267 [Phialophora macrospora]|uniref:Uncharacterized protein n=1 Tax=Phialophora macrospora TaxID=1851006 RepID=A0A0D2GI90_9EURO|nr:hypothetical protein PV04_00267 [Phialophora macrospora]